jgi:hypothetical protein
MLKALGKEQAGELGHCLYYQDTGHNGRAGKMPLEKLLVEGDVFYSLYKRITFKLDYLVNEQKRITVWKNPGYLADVEEGVGAELGGAFLPFGLLIELVNHLLIERVAAFIGDNSSFDRPAYQGKVAYEVNDFVSDTLVGKSVRVFDGAVGIYHEDVSWRQMCAHSVRLELSGLHFEQKSSGASEVLFKKIGCQPATKDLSAYSGVAGVVEVVCDIKSIIRIGHRVNGGVAGCNDDGLTDCKFTPGGLLFDKARVGQRPEVFAAAAIRRGKLRPVNFDNEIVYFKGVDGRQTMFDGFDADGAFFQGGASRSLSDIGGNGPDTDRLGHVSTDEDDARIDRRGSKNGRYVLAVEQPSAANDRRTCYRLLRFQVFPPLLIIF